MTFDQILAAHGPLVATRPGVPAGAATDPTLFGAALLRIRQDAPAHVAELLGQAAAHYIAAVEHSAPHPGHAGPCCAELLTITDRHLDAAKPHLQ